MGEAIETFYDMVSSKEFRELERLRLKAKQDEILYLNSALNEGIGIGAKEEREKWQSVVSEKDTVISEKEAILSEKDAILSEKDMEIAKQSALIEELMRRLNEKK